MDLIIDVANWLGSAERWTLTMRSGIPYRLFEHVAVSLVATVVAVIVALPPALWLAHRRRFEVAASAVVNIGRAIPSFGLIVVFWLGATRADGIASDPWPLVGALVALALPPIFTNAYTAVRELDPAVVEAARGMGLAERDVLRRVELPLASPVVLAGVRLAFVQVIATTAIGAIVTNGGGLGRYVVDGFALGVSGRATVFAGALLLAGLTLLVDAVFGLIERAVVPNGVRGEARLADVANRAGAAG